MSTLRQTVAQRARRLLEHPRLPWGLALLAMVLCLQSLSFGWMMDDYYHRAALDPPAELASLERSPDELFAWIGEPWQSTPESLPWWAHEDLTIAFWRPVTGWSHGLDYALWPDEPRWMHLQSLLWFGLTVLVATCLFHRLTPGSERWIAGLAAVLFAIDDAHGIPVVWIANRNAVLSTLFGLLALLAYHRWRHDGWVPGGWLAPAALLLAVLAGEAAVACGAYLLSYALFLDRGPLKTRLIALIPCTVVGVLWRVAYSALGYGAVGSGFYMDPGSQPLRFLEAVFERLPVLLWGQFGFPTADLYNVLSQSVVHRFWWVATLAVVLAALFVVPLLRREAVARFWAVGMVLSLLPPCATFPGQRLMFYASLGGAGLLALFVARAWSQRGTLGLGWRRTARVASVPLLLIHLMLSPIALWSTASSWSGFGGPFNQAAATLPSDAEIRQQDAVLLNPPSHFLSNFSVVYQALQGRPIPRDTLTLAGTIYPTEIHRPDSQTLVLRPAGGFLAPAGSAPEGYDAPTLDLRYIFQTLDSIGRDATPFQPGDRIPYRSLEVEILEITPDGRPAAVAFHFAADLEDPRWRWLRWEAGGFTSWSPPAIGSTVKVP